MAGTTEDKVNWKRFSAAALMAASLQTGMLVGAVAGVALATSAFADDWCSEDPPLYIVTPAGTRLVLHATFYALGKQHQDALKKAKMWYVVESKRARQNQGDSNGNKDDKTDVAVMVVVPGDQYGKDFPVRTVISTEANGGGKVHARAESRANNLMVLRFTLDIP